MYVYSTGEKAYIGNKNDTKPLGQSGDILVEIDKDLDVRKVYKYDGSSWILKNTVDNHGSINDDVQGTSELDGVYTQLGEKANQNQVTESVLTEWRDKFSRKRTKKLVLVGDSTVANMTGYEVPYINNNNKNGRLLEGLSVLNLGSGGNTCQNFNNNAPSGYGLQDAIDEQADIYLFCYGINDVRLGLCDQTTLISRLEYAIEKILTETNGYIIMKTPNSLCSDSPNGYISPSNAGQTYTNIMWEAYETFRNKYSRVYVWDVQTEFYGRTSVAVASNPNMGDELHPNASGHTWQRKTIEGMIGTVKAIDNVKLKDSWETTTPYTTYAKFPEFDPRGMIVIGKYTIANSSTSQLGLNLLWDNRFDVQIDDIIQIGDRVAFALPNASYSQNGSYTNLGFSAMSTYNQYCEVGGLVTVYRKIKRTIFASCRGENISGKVIGCLTNLHGRFMIKNFYCTKDTYERTTTETATIKLYHVTGTAKNEIGTFTFTGGANELSVNFVWNTTNFPNSYVDIRKLEVVQVICTTTNYTGDCAFGVIASE